MNQAQIHLALNHAPLFLALVAGPLLIISYLKKNELVAQIGLYGLVAAALFTLPVYFTGEGTEEIVEKFGVNEKIIEDHESFAGISLAIIGFSGFIALLALFIRSVVGRSWLRTMALLLSLVSFGTMAWTAHLGGLIRHTELAAGITVQPANENNGGENGNQGKEKGGEKDDD